MKEYQLSNSQELAFKKAVNDRKNIFLTGKAGSGKSFLTKIISDKLSKNGLNVACLGTTGIAALNVNGVTIHSFFKIPVGGIVSYDDIRYVKSSTRKIWNKTDVIIIDEVSMLRSDTFDAIDYSLKKNKCSSLSSKQIILVGDKNQLPPVINEVTKSCMVKDFKYDDEWFYSAKCYNGLNIEEVDLIEPMRQSDVEFVENLNIIRGGGKSQYFKKFTSRKEYGIILAPYRDQVETYNRREFSKIDSEVITFTAEISMCDEIINKQYKDKKYKLPSPEDFNLESIVAVKNGCKIMYLANEKDSPLRNGTVGIFRSEMKDDGLKYYIYVDGNPYEIKRRTFESKDYIINKDGDFELVKTGEINQMPIRLAYALTIHKSQGLTFDEITVDLSRGCFVKGQLYVALSRVKSPSGLHIKIN